MAFDPNAAKGLAQSTASTVDSGLRRLALAKSAKPSESDAEAEPEGEGGGSESGVLSALGEGGGTLVEYAGDVDAALQASKALRKLALDDEPDAEMVEAVEATFDELPTHVQLAIEACAEVDPAAVEAAGEWIQERKLAKNGARLAAFIVWASRLAALGSSEHEEPDGDEGEGMDSDPMMEA